MIIKNLLEPNKNSIWSAVLWTTLMLFFSFKAPAINPKYIFQYQDKVVHFLFYFVFVFLWCRVLRFKQKKRERFLWLTPVIAITLGAIVEIAQETFTQNRHAELSDFLANSFGAIVGMVFSSHFFKKENQ